MVIDHIEQLRVLLTPPRVDLLRLMGRERTCTDIGKALSMSPQKVYYHIKTLEKAGFVRKEREKRINGIMQGYYRSSASAVSVSPRLVAALGGARRLTSDVSLSRLLDMADQLTRDVQRLADEAESPASFSVDARISLPAPEQRGAFRREVEAAIKSIARRYGTGDETGDVFRLMLTCYKAPKAVDTTAGQAESTTAAEAGSREEE